VKPFISYTLARVALLAVTIGVLYAVGLRDLMLLILGFLVSGLISLIILNNQRSQLGSGIANFFTRLNAKIDANSRKEDSGD
jgi:uncharacterized protein YejL (UPF0352 family)